MTDTPTAPARGHQPRTTPPFLLTRKGRSTMSPFLFDADLANTQLGCLRRKSTTVSDAYAASIIDDYLAARAASNGEQMSLIRDHAYAIDPQLVDELDGFDYPAAA